MQEQFYPKQSLQVTSYSDFKSQYEAFKAVYEADHSAVENCLGKCNVSFNEGTQGERENTCLKKCFIKYFDSALLIEKEMTHFVHGMNIA